MVPIATLKRSTRRTRESKLPSALASLRLTRTTTIVRKVMARMMTTTMTMKTATQRMATRTYKSKTITQKLQIQRVKYL